MNNITSRKQALEEKIGELEDSLLELKQQLRKEIEDDQHEAIDQLEVYLDQLDNKYANLRGFWHILKNEISDLFSSENSK